MGKVEDRIAAAQTAIARVDSFMLAGGAQNKPQEILDSMPKVPLPGPLDVPFEPLRLIGGLLTFGWLQSQLDLVRESFYKDFPAVRTAQNINWTKPMLSKLGDYAKKYHAGQCNEQSAIAFNELVKQGAGPIDFVVLTPTDRVDHSFLVIGRTINKGEKEVGQHWDVPDNGAPPWGPDAVCCDPWSSFKSNRAYKAADIRKYAPVPGWWGVKTVFRWTG